jgi:molecular chaperone GrpE
MTQSAGGVRNDPAGEMPGTTLDRPDDRAASFDQAADTPQTEPATTATGAAPDLDALTAALTSLEKQISRAGREQFKASMLAEAQRDQLNEVLAALRATEANRNAELEALSARSGAIAAQARQEVARAILPAIDGLDAALQAGNHIVTATSMPSPRGRFWRRRAAPPGSDETLRDDLRAWLLGLEFVRDRLLAVLAAQDILPIEALGQPFDPHVHQAVEVSKPEPAMLPGTVTAVLRNGYQIGGQVIRPAEVAVARSE